MKRLLLLLAAALFIGCAARRKIVVTDRGFFAVGQPVSYIAK